jgi:hypothetical protein
MTGLMRALDAESLKLKRTLALRMALLAPLAMTIYIVVAWLLGGEDMMPASAESAWHEFIQVTSIFWTLLMLPLFVTLQTSLMGGIEHRNQGWKHLYALPLPRWTVCLAKQIVTAGLMALSHAALVGFTAAGGCLLWLLRPGLGFHAAIPWRELVLRAAVAYLASGTILAIHTWVGLRWRSFAAAMAVGMVLTVAGMVMINSAWGSTYPWALAGGIINGMGKGEPFRLFEFLFGALGGLLLTPLACWHIARRDVL